MFHFKKPSRLQDLALPLKPVNLLAQQHIKRIGYHAMDRSPDVGTAVLLSLPLLRGYLLALFVVGVLVFVAVVVLIEGVVIAHVGVVDLGVVAVGFFLGDAGHQVQGALGVRLGDFDLVAQAAVQRIHVVDVSWFKAFDVSDPGLLVAVVDFIV